MNAFNKTVLGLGLGLMLVFLCLSFNLAPEALKALPHG